MDIWRSCIGSHSMYGKENIFMTSVIKRVKLFRRFGVLMASYLVDFLTNHGHPLYNLINMITIYCSP